MTKPSLLILPGDGIGPEVMTEVRRIISWFGENRGLDFDSRHAPFPFLLFFGPSLRVLSHKFHFSRQTAVNVKSPSRLR